MNYIIGLISSLLGLFVGALVINLAAKPSNAPLSLDPVEALQIYFFSFSWAGGAIGGIIGALLLIVYLTAWAVIGAWLYRKLAGPPR